MNENVYSDGKASQEPKARVQRWEELFSGLVSRSMVDQWRRRTGYNPRQRKVTAQRLLLVVLEGFIMGQTMGFATLRALFVARFGAVSSCGFQNRFRSAQAVEFFKLAYEEFVQAVVSKGSMHLKGVLNSFDDVRVVDGTKVRVPPRGAEVFGATNAGKAGMKWVAVLSLLTGVFEQMTIGAQRAAEIPAWRRLAGELKPNVLYLLDLGFFERDLFRQAQQQGAEVLMRCKSGVKLKLVGHVCQGKFITFQPLAVSTYLSFHSRKKGTVYDLDVIWGTGASALRLRMVGYAHNCRKIRWYLTTVDRDRMSASDLIKAYRLRWLIELGFRELKQQADVGRCNTANEHAAKAFGYAVMLAHAFVRSLRLAAACAHDVPVEQLRPLAVWHMIRAHAHPIINALQNGTFSLLENRLSLLFSHILLFAHEPHPSKSRYPIARAMGAVGG